jgi:hypothetical protein
VNEFLKCIECLFGGLCSHCSTYSYNIDDVGKHQYFSFRKDERISVSSDLFIQHWTDLFCENTNIKFHYILLICKKTFGDINILLIDSVWVSGLSDKTKISPSTWLTLPCWIPTWIWEKKTNWGFSFSIDNTRACYTKFVWSTTSDGKVVYMFLKDACENFKNSCKMTINMHWFYWTSIDATAAVFLKQLRGLWRVLSTSWQNYSASWSSSFSR